MEQHVGGPSPFGANYPLGQHHEGNPPQSRRLTAAPVIDISARICCYLSGCTRTTSSVVLKFPEDTDRSFTWIRSLRPDSSTQSMSSNPSRVTRATSSPGTVPDRPARSTHAVVTIWNRTPATFAAPDRSAAKRSSLPSGSVTELGGISLGRGFGRRFSPLPLDISTQPHLVSPSLCPQKAPSALVSTTSPPRLGTRSKMML